MYIDVPDTYGVQLLYTAERAENPKAHIRSLLNRTERTPPTPHDTTLTEVSRVHVIVFVSRENGLVRDLHDLTAISTIYAISSISHDRLADEASSPQRAGLSHVDSPVTEL